MATVLLVEDDPANAQMVAAMLMRAGHTVLTKPDGPGGLEAVRSWPVDLVLLDVSLAGSMTGLDVCRAIRADPNIAGIPIMILSGWSFDSDLKAGRAAGADDYLPKPFIFAVFSERVQCLLDRAHAAPARPPSDGSA